MKQKSLNKLISNVVNFFVHPTLTKEKSVYEKSKTSIVVFLVSFLIVIIYTLFYTYKGFYTDIKALHNYLGVFVLGFSLILVKIFGKINLALGAVAFFSLYLVGSSIFLSGGIRSNDTIWFFVVCASAFMFVSYQVGILISVFAVIIVSVFYFMEMKGIVYGRSNDISLSFDYRYFNFVLILILLSSMFYLLVKGNQKLQEIIQKNKEQQIRVEIARDFHDQIGNKLASLQHLTELIKLNKTEEEKKEILVKINDNAKLVYDNFRDFIWTLDSKSDSINELFMYLRDFADDFFRFSKVNFYTYSLPEKLPDIVLPNRISREVVPIFKEAITNISKHAKAQNVHFGFILTEENFEIHLVDDGVGFNISEIKLGKGLGNLKHRSIRAGGEIEIHSELSKGTKIIFSIKLPKSGSD